MWTKQKLYDIIAKQEYAPKDGLCSSGAGYLDNCTLQANSL